MWAQLEEASFSLLYACTAERALMVEASGARGGAPDSVFAEALQFAHKYAVQLIPPQLELARMVARPKVKDNPGVQWQTAMCTLRIATLTLRFP
jgi:polyribonucleotide nucleotidyltransferase